METKNAIITNATITTEGNILSAWLILDYGGDGQGFGGYALYLPRINGSTEIKSVAGHFIWRAMEIAGVDEWSRMVGKTIRVRGDHGRVYAIGHIIKDDWFDPTEDFKEVGK